MLLEVRCAAAPGSLAVNVVLALLFGVLHWLPLARGRRGPEAMGVLSGLRVVEIAGLGPAPFCGMLLADMGADVVLVERAGAQGGDPLSLGRNAIVHRGKRSLALDLKDPAAVDAVLRLVDGADALIEGMRPGVMERLGLGPDACLARNPRLVYGRMTGWGQDGPLAQAAGHDINYIALSGALWFSGAPGEPPMAPPTLVGDLGGGALYLAMGVLAALLSARSTGVGQVIDAAIVDGSANLMNLLLSAHAAGQQPFERGHGPARRPALVRQLCLRRRRVRERRRARAAVQRAAVRPGWAWPTTPTSATPTTRAAGRACASAWPRCSPRSRARTGWRCSKAATPASRPCSRRGGARAPAPGRARGCTPSATACCRPRPRRASRRRRRRARRGAGARRAGRGSPARGRARRRGHRAAVAAG